MLTPVGEVAAQLLLDILLLVVVADVLGQVEVLIWRKPHYH
jgi:hypothetical protein